VANPRKKEKTLITTYLSKIKSGSAEIACSKLLRKSLYSCPEPSLDFVRLRQINNFEDVLFYYHCESRAPIGYLIARS